MSGNRGPCPCMRAGFWPLTILECPIHGDTRSHELDRLRARVAELEAAGIDARTDHRVIATDSAGMRAESEWKRDRDLVESWASLWESEGWTVHSIESRTVSTTTRTTAWKADER